MSLLNSLQKLRIAIEEGSLEHAPTRIQTLVAIQSNRQFTRCNYPVYTPKLPASSMSLYHHDAATVLIFDPRYCVR